MLRVNVGLSRKVSKDYNSTGFSINLDGEITASPNDAEAVIVQVKELFDLAEEALNQEIERYQCESAIAARDEEPRPAPHGNNGHGNGNGQRLPAAPNGTNGSTRQPPGNGQPEGELATSKQINYLLNIGKRQRLSTVQLERRIAEVLGQPVGLYELSKRDAAKVIDVMTKPAEQAAHH